MRCMIVDDDPLARLVLENFIAQNNDLDLVASCAGAVDAVNVLNRSAVDLMFLDIEMPDMTGVELAESLTDPPQIILVTAREEYALKAFELDVLDYLVKPVTYRRFLKAVQRARRQAERSTPAPTEPAHVFVKTDGRLVKLDLASVQWIEAQGDYALIRTRQRKLVVHSTMKSLEDKLPRSQFARVHRSFIVRVDQIDGIEESSIVMDREVIPIGSSYRDGLLQRLNTI